MVKGIPQINEWGKKERWRDKVVKSPMEHAEMPRMEWCQWEEWGNEASGVKYGGYPWVPLQLEQLPRRWTDFSIQWVDQAQWSSINNQFPRLPSDSKFDQSWSHQLTKNRRTDGLKVVALIQLLHLVPIMGRSWMQTYTWSGNAGQISCHRTH